MNSNPRRSRRHPAPRFAILGLRAGALALCLQGCNSLPLEPWHTRELAEEFTARKTDDVRTFEDYLRLEDRVFAEQEETIYADTETGPAQKLVRYSTGSASDPLGRQPNWNRSFELPADAPAGGILLLHGMSDSPYSLRALGQSLNRRGLWIVGLRLPGHGTVPSELLGVRWEDMAAAVRLAMAHLTEKVGQGPIHIIGYSNGAPLALDFALDATEGKAAPVPASLVLISPALGVRPTAALAKWKRRLARVPGLGDLAWLEVAPEFDPYKYNSFTTNAGEQVFRLTRSVARRLESRFRSRRTRDLPPMLVFKSTVDATVSTEAVVDRLLGRMDPHRHELVLFDINRHAAKSILLVADPQALTTRVMGDSSLPFAVTLVTNESPESPKVVARHQPPFSADVSHSEPLHLAWPTGVVSLSHVALPFPPDDPLYGQRAPEDESLLFLGQMALQGERGMLVLPSDWLLRLRHNPFYEYLEKRVQEWVERPEPPPG